MAQLNNRKLLDFLGEVDKELNKNITLVAVGGTALTLLKTKTSTLDVDFTIPGEEDYALFMKTLKSIPHGFKVDCYVGDLIFSEALPDDYLKKSIPIKSLKNIRLRALHPVDIVVTKLTRLNERDKEDIGNTIKKFKLTKSQLKKRANQVEHAGSEESYRTNLDYVLRNLFK